MDKTQVLDRVVKLVRLMRGTPNAEERDTAGREVARLKRKHRLSDAEVEAALENASGPHTVDAGPLGPESPAAAELLGNVFGDDIVRDGRRASGKAARRPRAEEAARRYAYLAEQMRLCAERRGIAQRDVELFYAIVALTVEDRLKDLRKSQAPRRGQTRTGLERAKSQRGGGPASRLTPPAAPARPARLTRLGDLRTPPGKAPKMIRLGEAVQAAAEAARASSPLGGLPEHVVTAGVEEGELRVDIAPLVAGVNWADCPQPKERA